MRRSRPDLERAFRAPLVPLVPALAVLTCAWLMLNLTALTWLRFLDHPCEHCHKLKTRQGWAYVEGKGKRPLVPPEDPRHPKHKREQAS